MLLKLQSIFVSQFVLLRIAKKRIASKETLVHAEREVPRASLASENETSIALEIYGS